MYSTDNIGKFKVEITQDKLVDLLLHAATREDIANLKQDNDKQFQNIINLIEASEARNDRQFIKIDQRYNWIIGIILGTGFTILFSMVGMIAKGFHWM